MLGPYMVTLSKLLAHSVTHNSANPSPGIRFSPISQLVKPGSTLEKLKVAAKERNLFFWGGLASFGSVFMLSMLSLVFDRRLVSSALHLVLAMSTMSMVSSGSSLSNRGTHSVNESYHHQVAEQKGKILPCTGT